LVHETYTELGKLLEEGDDTFIERGPVLLKEAIQNPDFFDGVRTETAIEDYTRKKVIGKEGQHVIRFMEWPPEYSLLPHEHHGRPCFEVLVEGQLYIADMEPIEVDNDQFTLEMVNSYICNPRDSAVIDPRTGYDIHAVYSPVRTRSLHVYPEDNYYSIGYVPTGNKDPTNDRYERQEFQLDE
jgi:hypothetical protein